MKPKLQKANFCKDFIVPWTTKAAHYIDLYRRIQQRGGISVEKIQRWNFYPLLVPNIFIWRNAWRLCEVCHQGFGVDARGILLFKNLISWWPVLAWSYPWHFMTRSLKDLDFPIVMLIPNLTTCYPLFIVVVTYKSDSKMDYFYLKFQKIITLLNNFTFV